MTLLLVSKSLFFHFWDQQKCHSSNTAHWIQKNPMVIKFYFGFKVLNPKDENFWRQSVDNPLVIVVVTKKGCQETDLKKSHLQDLRLWNQNKTKLPLGISWFYGIFLSYGTFVGLKSKKILWRHPPWVQCVEWAWATDVMWHPGLQVCQIYWYTAA